MKHLFIALGIGLLLVSAGRSFAIPPVNLGTASNFAILAGSAVSNTGSSLINGDLGISPLTAVSGFPPGTLNGVQYIADGVALQAQNDLTTAYNDAAGRVPVTTVATELGGTTLPPGVYNSASGTFGITGTLTLDAQNDPSAVFVFQMESTLITASSSQVVLARGAQACNVFWQVGSSATLGTFSSFIGDILALTSITVTTGVVMDGRTLARNGAVTLDTDTITTTTCASTCIPDDQVTLVPNNPGFPGPQDVHGCAFLSALVNTQVIVPVNGSQNVPTVTITSGCLDCGDQGCEPLSDWVLGNWTFVANPPAYVANLTAGADATGCCVCLHLDFVLPVQLLAFEGQPRDHAVQLIWATASEINASHFVIMRDGQAVANVAAANNATGSNYLWTDTAVQNGRTYRYDLLAVSVSGVRQNLGSVAMTPSANVAEVTQYALHQNYPNPFNPTTEIVYEMRETGFVSLKVYNVFGQNVATLVNGNMDAGRYVVGFDASHLPSGLYLYRMETNGFAAGHKMLLMK